MVNDQNKYENVFTDQMGRRILLEKPPQRIISLVPSITELLFDLDLQDKVVGRTRFCVHPQSLIRQIPIVGGTKKLHMDRIRRLSPDLIIANKEENVKEDIEKLAAEYIVWVSEVPNLEASMDMIQRLGQICRKEEEAREIITQSTSAINSLHSSKSKSVAYLIWKDPYMTVGGDTYIHDMLSFCGWDNVFGDQKRYPSFELAELVSKGTELILLSSEPFPFKQKHLKELEEQTGLPVMLVDGEACSWYGSRLIKKGAYLRTLSSH